MKRLFTIFLSYLVTLQSLALPTSFASLSIVESKNGFQKEIAELNKTLEMLKRGTTFESARAQYCPASPAAPVAREPKSEAKPKKIDENKICIDYNEADYLTGKIPENVLNPKNTSFEQNRNFMEYMIPLAFHFQEKYKIPADLTLVNATLISSWGQSEHFRKYNNPFAVACEEVSNVNPAKDCSADGKYYKFNNMYEAFDFHIRQLYFSGNFPNLQKVVEEETEKNKNRDYFVVDRKLLVPNRASKSALNSSVINPVQKALIDDWNKFGGFKKESLGEVLENQSYHDRVSVLLKDWFSSVDYSKVKLCEKEGKAPPSSGRKEPPRLESPSVIPGKTKAVGETHRGEAPVDGSKVPAKKKTNVEENTYIPAEEKILDLRERFEAERAYGHFSSVKNGRYNPGKPENFNDFALLEEGIDLIHPVKKGVTSNVSSSFGYRISAKREHGGIDVAAKRGTPLVAVADGVVLKSGFSESYGHFALVQLKDKNGDLTPFSVLYAHMDGDETIEDYGLPAYGKNQIEVGAEVKQGDLIGLVGDSGEVDPGAYHLHFELHHQWVDEAPSDVNRVVSLPYRVNPEFYPAIREIFGMSHESGDIKYTAGGRSDRRALGSLPKKVKREGFIYR